MWKKFTACPNYLGGKRKLIPEIFKHVPSPEESPVFADAFFGGGSVSLWAKAIGHRVVSNDLAERSYLTAKALIVNQTVKITQEDMIRLFAKKENDGFIEKNYSPKVFTHKIAKFLDTAFANITDFPEHKRDILKLLLIKFILSTRPFGHFSSTTNTVKLDVGDYDYPLRNRSYAKQNLKQVRSPLEHLKRCAKSINYGVFDNGEKNEARLGDVFDFIRNVKADIAYFDPPYAETASYEETYNVLDNILAKKMKKPDISAFTKKSALEFQDRLYASATHIKHWIISMGQTNTETGISPEELLAVVKKYKPNAKVRLLHHDWSINNSIKKKQGQNVEYMIYTYEKA